MKELLSILLIYGCAITAFAETGFQMKEFGKGSNKYWLIIPETDQPINQNLVVFLHGYGASNPACYGGWINEIVQTNHVVLFPKFQLGTGLPNMANYEQRVDEAIKASEVYLKENHGISNPGIVFVTHSIGGVIASNLSDRYGETQEQTVTGLLLVQPGHKKWELGANESFENMNPSAKIICITGSEDRTAGNTFSEKVIMKTPQIGSDQKLWLNQFEDESEDKEIGSSHIEPISIDRNFDSGSRNLVVSGALALGKTNEVDQNCYWRITSLLLELAHDPSKSLDKESHDLVDMGTWGQKPIRSLQVVY